MTYVKCYKYGTYPAAATNPCVVETNGSTPASCNDISPAWFSEDFSGTSLDCRWTETKTTGVTTSVSANKYNVSITGSNQPYYSRIVSYLTPLSSDFTIQVDIVRENKTFTAGNADDAVQGLIFLYSGTSEIALLALGELPNSSVPSERYHINSDITGTILFTEKQIYSTSFKFIRESGVLKLYYLDSGNWIQQATKSIANTIDNVRLMAWNDTNQSCNFEFSNLVVSVP